ncbi:uncharacterized protein B0I36DRAFT_328901 [Microdochium trichocladiopsis]|uniref:Uncharacterized protein n=1 Tax=Microdochium trichocladiopsis TaxID=1682393 RepID=A0A9P9BJK8_9PEZI|nr:uncharacterized protein B0I36DRAFT_328901 [Microdochium trichocladiopsis]KAH7025674.1 hypothetical protein B0I36DRAFT_328901 [Microdochium trichocladiopsis]
MAAITTTVRVGTVEQWCILPKWSPWEVQECAAQFATKTASAAAAPAASDFFNVCCEGTIISRSRSLLLEAMYADASNASQWEMWLDDLVCCNARGSKQSAFFGAPVNIHDGIGTTWTAGTPTPLASMAAINTDNAALYTYTLTAAPPPPGVSCDPAAVFGCNDVFGASDSIWTGTPYCMWMNTARSSNAVTTITVPAADITTVATPTLIEWGSDDQTSSRSTRTSSRTTTTEASSETTAPPSQSFASTTAPPSATTSTPSSAPIRTSYSHMLLGCLAVVAIALGA